ncbi:hypothetical protein [Mycolicibacterium sp.]|uniref:hypothetical protein n=1 Tax=Mycolicibacterium sp. TaxID=2320850 RepID=UPI0025CC64CF|nr:hypothetical protein [Mycolicibacterium sp.]
MSAIPSRPRARNVTRFPVFEIRRCGFLPRWWGGTRSNRSDDIIGLFTAALDHLEIHWTRSTKYIVSVYRKADTARLDEFIGPKSVAVPWTNVHYTS